MSFPTFPMVLLMFLSREEAFIFAWKEAESETEQPNYCTHMVCPESPFQSGPSVLVRSHLPSLTRGQEKLIWTTARENTKFNI